MEELLGMDPSSCDSRLVDRIAKISLQVAEDNDYQPSMSDWRTLIGTLQASDKGVLSLIFEPVL